MAQVSQKKLNNKIWNQVWGNFLEALIKVNDVDKTQILITGLLSNTEKIMLSKRLMIAVLSRSDWSPKQISQLLGLSLATVYKHISFLELNKDFDKLLDTIFPNKIPKPTKNSFSSRSDFSRFIKATFEGRRNRSKLLYFHLNN